MSTTATSAIPTGTWTLDPVHSTVGFEIDYMGGTFKGEFRDIAALTYERAFGLPSDACGIATRFDGRIGYIQFAGLAPLAFVDDPHWLTDRSGDPACAGELLAQAQGMLTWRMLAAERRLTGCTLMPDGVVGSYDPL